MFYSRGAKVSKQLSNVLIGKSAARLQLNDEALFDEQVGAKLAEDRPILIKHR